MRFIRFLWEISWRSILIATITGLISGGSNAMLISLINRAVSQASLPNALLYFAALALCTLFTSTVAQFMLINLSQNAIYQLRVRLGQNILSSPLEHLERLGENRLLATLTDDVRVLSHAVSAIPSICIDLATVLGCLFYLSLISNIIFVLTIATSALAIWCVQTRLGKAQHLFSIAREEEDNLFKHFQAITRGTKELKLHKTRREDFSSKNLQGSATKLRQKNTTAMQSFAIANGLGQPIDDEKGFLLGPISLTLQPGQITYIVGGNGSGKSTLAKLITGLYPPKNGSIYLDGVLITDENREWYRQHFSAIFSDFYLFDSCLGFNHPNLDREVESYLRQLQLDHKVQVRDGVLSTTNLSQGQRKRLALLTAYLEDRPIYLFDEWASDQEPHFRDLFYRQSLVKLKERGKAVIVITHDDRYFHLADQIIKLDYGKVQPDYVPIRFS